MKWKYIALAVLAVHGVCSATAGNDRAKAIITMLNSSVACSPNAYADAVKVVAADAAAGGFLQQYVMALFSENPYTPAECRLSGETRSKYLERTREKFFSIARRENANPLAQYLVAIDVGDTNLLAQAASKNNIQAANAWGTLIISKFDGPDPSGRDRLNMAEALPYFRRAALDGHLAEMGGLSDREIVSAIEKTNERDTFDSNGLYNLGMCYSRGLGVAPDRNLAFRLFILAASMGHPLAMNSLGWCFQEGLGTERDLEKSTLWYSRSAACGNKTGQFNYAVALQEGIGVEPDLESAARFLKMSADAGFVDAIFRYADALAGGKGVEMDKPAALKLFKKAAKKGLPSAMMKLSQIYRDGDIDNASLESSQKKKRWGVNPSAEESLIWKQRARSACGDSSARHWLISRKLPLL